MSLTLRNTALFLVEAPSIVGEVALVVSAAMAADAKMIYAGSVGFEESSEFISDLARQILADADPLEATAELPEITGAYIAINAAALMVGTAELDPAETEMQRGGSASLSVVASLSPGTGSITYYAESAMAAAAVAVFEGGLEWRGQLPLLLTVTLDATARHGTVGLNDPGFVNGVMVVDAAQIIGGLTDDSWRVSANMAAAADGLLAGLPPILDVSAGMLPIQAGVIRSAAANLNVSASLLSIAQDINNLVVEWDVSVSMTTEAFVQQGGWLDMVATAELAISEENFYRYRIAEVGDAGQEVVPPLHASAYLDVVLDGLVAGRPYALRASAKMAARARLGGEVVLVEGEIDFRPQSEFVFDGVTLSYGSVAFEPIFEYTASGGIRLTSSIDFQLNSTITLEPTVIVTEHFIYPDPITVDVDIFDPTLVPLVVTIWMEGIKAIVRTARPSAVGGVTQGLIVTSSDRMGSSRVVASDSLIAT